MERESEAALAIADGIMDRRRFFGMAAAGYMISAIPILGIAGCSTAWIAVAEKDAPIVVSIAETVVSVVATLTGSAVLTPAAVAIIQEAAAAFQAGMQTLSDAIAAYKASPDQTALGKIVAAINAVEQDAPAVIKAIAQAPGGLISVITSAIGIAVSLISAIESLLPTTATFTGNAVSVPPAKRMAVNGVKLPDAQTMKSNFNAVLSVYGYGQFMVK